MESTIFMSISSDNNLDIKKQQQPASTQSTGNNTTAPETEKKFTSLFIGMLKSQAADSLLSTFEKYDNFKTQRGKQIGNSDGIIQDKEYTAWKTGMYIEQKEAAETVEINEMKQTVKEKCSHARDKKLLNYALENIGINDEIQRISKLAQSTDKKDFDTILKEILGEDEYNKIADL